MSSVVSFYRISHMNNSDVFCFYTEPISSIIFKLDVAACFKKCSSSFVILKKKDDFCSKSHSPLPCRLGYFSDSVVRPGSLPGSLSLREFRMSFVDFFLWIFPTCWWSKAELFQAWLSLDFDNATSYLYWKIISVLFPQSLNRHQQLKKSCFSVKVECEVLWRVGSTLIFAWKKHPRREHEAVEQMLCPGGCSFMFSMLNSLPLRLHGCSTGCACSPGMLWICRSGLFWIWLSIKSSSVAPIFSGICLDVKLLPSSSMFSVVKGP